MSKICLYLTLVSVLCLVFIIISANCLSFSEKKKITQSLKKTQPSQINIFRRTQKKTSTNGTNMTYSEDLKYEQFASDTDNYFQLARVINFDIVHHECCGNPL